MATLSVNYYTFEWDGQRFVVVFFFGHNNYLDRQLVDSNVSRRYTVFIILLYGVILCMIIIKGQMLYFLRLHIFFYRSCKIGEKFSV